jgi:hypothetical protein
MVPVPDVMIQQIDYARERVKWFRRGGVRRVLLPLGTVVVVGICVWSWAPVVVRQVERIRAQRECLAHTPVAQLVSFNCEGWDVIFIWSRPEEFNRLLDSSQLRNTHKEALLFLHERHMPNGPSRLVVVSFDRNSPSNPVRAQVMELRIFGQRRVRSDDQIGFPQFWPKADWNPNSEAVQPFQIFEGRADVDDSTHFTIPYEMDGKHGIVDGWLVEDRFVKLQVRAEGTGR